MTAYQTSWNSEIEKLLSELKAPDSLYKELVFILSHNELTQIFPNQVINALRIAKSIQSGNINTCLVAPMQSGKSGTIYVLVNYILPLLNLIEINGSVIFVTSMRDKDLFIQNKENLERDYYSVSESRYLPSKINVSKMDEFFKHPNPYKLVKDFKTDLIIRDEDQYGSGTESSFDFAFFENLRKKLPEIGLLSVSATPYDILDAKIQGYDVELIDGERPEKYFGISEMLDHGVVENYPNDFNSLQKTTSAEGLESYMIHPKIEEYISFLNSFKDGLGIIRISNSQRAIVLRDEIRANYNNKLECIVIGSNMLSDFKINEGLDYVKKQVLNQSKRVVLIVVQALTAGKDLRLLKEKVRFGVESRNKQLANGAQGIAGRLCGYHSNRDFKLMASVDLLKHYSAFEMDPEVFADQVWQNELYNQKVRGFSTHTRLKINRKQGVYTPVLDVETISIDDLKNGIYDKINFLNHEEINKVISVFEEDFINNANSMRLNLNKVTSRIASLYKEDDNRVYKNWNSTTESDFGVVFFRKREFDYGLLISNYKSSDPRNKLGFTGIKIFKSGVSKYLEQQTVTINDSMYSLEEN